ncbi:hypothetical protein TWF970_009688 [Orbilia oligospora]|uniref:Tetratricopeptide repeat protein n=1 Tax=Orbilia oligospora TaxID=2813651 RepID=A0A7C8VND7_ORBOL|nr:hypothetical protein TWF970_009688 [Orbilia oligospora]
MTSINSFDSAGVNSLTTVKRIGSYYCDIARYGEAMNWYQRALAGKDHPDTLATVYYIASAPKHSALEYFSYEGIAIYLSDTECYIAIGKLIAPKIQFSYVRATTFIYL